MSKIQEALKKLQKDGLPKSEARTVPGKIGRRRLPDSIIPIASKKKFVAAGIKHHLDEKDLVHRGLLAPLDHSLPMADEFRRIKRPLLENVFREKSSPTDHMNVILVTSALPGAGKTFCSVNLAASISLERELNVLLIDADIAKPHISTAFGLGGRPGLIELLENEDSNVENFLVRTDLNDIQVLPAGKRHTQSTELLASERMEQLISELATRYADRIIVMDSPPLLMTSEAQVLAKQVGQIALVIESDRTTHQEVQDALEILDGDKAINVILNKSVYQQSGRYYGGSYGYYGFNEADE